MELGQGVLSCPLATLGIERRRKSNFLRCLATLFLITFSDREKELPTCFRDDIQRLQPRFSTQSEKKMQRGHKTILFRLSNCKLSTQWRNQYHQSKVTRKTSLDSSWREKSFGNRYQPVTKSSKIYVCNTAGARQPLLAKTKTNICHQKDTSFLDFHVDTKVQDARTFKEKGLVRLQKLYSHRFSKQQT